MRKFFYFMFLFFIICISCGRKEVVDTGEDARELFRKSAELILHTTQQTISATDSASVDSLFKVYEKQITDINFACPPQTDFKLTEEENDSLFKLMNTLLEKRKEKLKALSIIRSDTLSFEQST